MRSRVFFWSFGQDAAKSVFMLLVCLLFTSLSFAALIPCPDCNKQVSERAVMCPNCGCPGDAIRVAAQSNQAAKVELPAYCHSLVRVTSDQGAGAGVCIQSSSNLYVLTSQTLLAGAQSLTITKSLDGQPVLYASIELASDRDLARLGTSETNINPLAIADASSASMTLVHVATNNTVIFMTTGAVNGPLPIGSPLLDAATNVVMLVSTVDGKHAENVGSVEAWILVKPLDYRKQTTLLQQAEKSGGDRAAVLKQLKETKWLTPFMSQKAEALIKEFQK